MGSITYKMFICLIYLSINYFMILYMSDLFLIWLIYEMMTLMFIVYMNVTSNFKYASVFFYLVSVISSLIFIMVLYYYITMSVMSVWFDFFVQLIMMVKLGMFPFHLWVIRIYEHMCWSSIFMFSTVMKMVPMYFLVNVVPLNKMFLLFIFLGFFMIPMIMMELNSVKMFISCSSIIQSSFMLLIMYMDVKIYLYYFIFYSAIFFLLLHFLDKFDVESFVDLGFLLVMKRIKFYFFLVSLIYSALPPFLSIILKWVLNNYILDEMLDYNLFLFLIMLSSVMVIFNYLSLIIFISNNYVSSKKYFYHTYLDFSYLFLFFILFFFFGGLLVNIIM